MNDLIIRDARSDEAEAILAVTLAANKQYGDFSPALWEGYKSNIVETLAHVAPAEQIVAERKGEILGTVLLYPGQTPFERGDGKTFTFETPEVRLLAVKPEARGQGIGKRLMEECLARSSKVGAPALTLHTTDLMKVAMGMYERMGFVRDTALDFEPAPGFTIKGYRYTF